MDYLRNLRDNILGVDRLSLLALVVIIVIVLAEVLFAWKFILPAWQDRKELTSQLAAAQTELEEKLKAQKISPDELRKKIEAAQAKLDDVANVFFSDSQADEALKKLYQYASESQVEIANLQVIPVPEEEKKASYNVGKYKLQVNGSLPNLMDFVTRIEEAAFDSFVISNVTIAQGGEGEEQVQHTLNMDIALYNSLPTPTPIATPTSTPVRTVTVEEQLAESLHEPWAAKDWETVIGIIEQILAVNPNYDDMVEKLYAAHINYGQQLVAENKLEEAKLEFTRALAVKPNGGEAILELQALAGETPAPSATSTPTPLSQPQYIIHVVQPGEWLYQIARMYGTTAQAIMTANGLTSSTIHPGQQLRIPTQ